MTNGEDRPSWPFPCVDDELHFGNPEFASQIHAHQSFFSFAKGNVSLVVVAAVARAPLTTEPETAH